MRLLIRTQGIDLTEQLCEHIQNRVRFALSRLGQNVQLVHVHLRDENGPRGGVAERCTLRTQVAGRDLIIERTHSDIRTAVSVASDRLGDAARRALARSQSVPR
jgi:ribosome-associated translation inhibitor RaiA